MRQPIATEVPCTLQVNGDELGTMLCTPANLKEFAVGYLFTSGLIQGVEEVLDFYCDETTWRLDITTPTALIRPCSASAFIQAVAAKGSCTTT